MVSKISYIAKETVSYCDMSIKKNEEVAYMNKVIKKTIAVLLSTVFMLSFSASAMDAETTLHEESMYEESTYGHDIIFIEDLLADPEFNDYIMDYLFSHYGEEFFVNQDIASATAELILSSFPQDRMGVIIFPEFYGGMYIDSYGNLVLLVTEGTAEGEALADIGRAGGANVRTVEFPYGELH